MDNFDPSTATEVIPDFSPDENLLTTKFSPSAEKGFDPSTATEVSQKKSSDSFDPSKSSRVYLPAELPKEDTKTLHEDENFDPAEYASNLSDEQMTPEVLRKLAEVRRERTLKGLDKGKIVKKAIKNLPETGKGILSGAKDTLKNLGKVYAAGAFGADYGMSEIGSAAFDPAVQELKGTMDEEGKKAGAELVASSETGVRNTAGLLRSGLDKLKVSRDEKGDFIEEKDLPIEHWEQKVLEDAELRKKEKTAAEGKGTWNTAIGLDADTLKKEGIDLDTKVISEMSFFTDPTSLVGIGYVFKGGKYLVQAGGKVLATTATAEAAAKAVSTISEAAQSAVAKGLKATGSGLKKTAKTVKELQAGPITGLLVDQAVGGSGLAGVAAGSAAPKVLKATGEALTTAGKKVAGEIPTGKVVGFVKGAVNNTVTRGAAAGAATSLPFVAAARNEDEAANFLGMGVLIGGAGNALHSTVKAGSEGVSKVAWKPEHVEPVTSPDYGTLPEWDEAHNKKMAELEKRRPDEVNAVNRLREYFRGTAEIYVLPKEEYAKVPGSHPNSVGVVVPIEGKKTIFLNDSTQALFHEPGHIVQDLMPAETLEKFHQEIKDNFTPEQIADFKKDYEARINEGQPETQHHILTDQETINELGAEVVSGVLKGSKLDGAPEGLVKSAAKEVGGLLEAVGIYTPEVVKETGENNVTAGGVKQPFGAAKVAEDFIKAHAEETNVAERLKDAEVKPTSDKVPDVDFSRPPTPEETKTRELKNIRVTRQDQNDFNAPRTGKDLGTDPKGISEAETALTDATPETKETFKRIATHIDRPQGEVVPVEIESGTIKTDEIASDRSTRRSEQAQGYIDEANGALPEDVREQTQKMLVPLRFVTRGKNVNLLGMSLDKVVANQHRVVKEAAEKGVEIPYESKDGKLTENGARDFVEDAIVYTQNQANGYAGNGKKIITPENYEGAIPEENPKHTPKELTDDKANFINLLMGLNPPKTNRIAKKGQTPANVVARTLAEANSKPAGESVTSNPQKSFYKDFGVEIAEFNPLRDKMAKAGVEIRDLIEVTEEVSLENIKTVKERPESRFRAPSTDAIRAGFMPKTAERDTSKKEVIENVLRNPGAKTELDKLKSGQSDGQTFNIDGTVFDAGTRKLDVVTLASENVLLSELTTERIKEFLSQFPDDLLENESLKPGVFKMADGKRASIDLNVVVPKEFRKNSEKFATDNNQESIFDLETFETVPTNGNGETVLSSPQDISKAARALVDGKEYDFKKSPVAEKRFMPESKTPANKDDLAEYNRLTEEIKKLNDSGKVFDEDFQFTPEYMKLQGEREQVKNRNGGMPPEGSSNFMPKQKEDRKKDQQSWLTPDGKFIPVDKNHGDTASTELGVKISEGVESAFKKNWVRVTTMGDSLYAHKGGERELAPLQKRELVKLAEDLGKSEIIWDNENDYKVIWQADEFQFMPKSKNLAKSPKLTESSKAWILPTGKYQPVDTYHENYLFDNSDALKKEFKLNIEGFKRGSEASRIPALNAGFVRVNYERNSGKIVFELATKHFNRQTKDQITEVIADNVSDIDNIRIALIDSKGKVDKVDSAQVFTYEDEEKLDHIPFISADRKSAPSNERETLFDRAVREDQKNRLDEVEISPKKKKSNAK